MYRPPSVVERDQIMKLLVPIALSLLATLLAVAATRLIGRSRPPIDRHDLPGLE